MNNTTRKYPRTIQEACGPHATSYITEPVCPFDWEDLTVMWGCVVAVVAVVLIGYLT